MSGLQLDLDVGRTRFELDRFDRLHARDAHTDAMPCVGGQSMNRELAVRPAFCAREQIASPPHVLVYGAWGFVLDGDLRRRGRRFLAEPDPTTDEPDLCFDHEVTEVDGPALVGASGQAGSPGARLHLVEEQLLVLIGGQQEFGVIHRFGVDQPTESAIRFGSERTDGRRERADAWLLDLDLGGRDRCAVGADQFADHDRAPTGQCDRGLDHVAAVARSGDGELLIRERDLVGSVHWHVVEADGVVVIQSCLA